VIRLIPQVEMNAGALNKKRKSMSSMRRKDYLWAYLMIAPVMIGSLIFHFWPLVQTFYLSFTEWGAFGTYKFSGLNNYEKMLHDPNLLSAMKNTSIFTLITVPVSLVISTLVALMLNQKVRGLTIYRTLFFLPVVTMPAAVSMVWKWLYNADYGLINYLMGLFSMNGPDWLTDPNIALYSISLVAVWGSIGNNMVIIISGLQGISSTYYEAASIDGAGKITQFFRITLPLLTPTLFFLTIISLISTFQVFDLVFLMIGQNSIAIGSTQTVVFLFFMEAFVKNDKGYATALAMLLFVIILIVTMVQFRLQKKWVHYE
jgi:multiple sugar transport system permease protein